MNQKNTFHAYEIAIELCRAVRPLIGKIEKHDRNLAEQVREAVTSVPMNLAEGNRRRGRDRLNRFRMAAGSADEVRAGLDAGEALGYVSVDDIASALVLVDRELAMLYRLTA